MDITIENIQVGQYVEIEDDQNKIHEGLVLKILSQSKKKGTRVLLNNQKEGKVIYIFSPAEKQRKLFSFWNKFIQSQKLFAVYDLENKEFVQLYQKNKNNQLQIIGCLFDTYEDAVAFLQENFSDLPNRYTIKNAKRNNFAFKAFPNATYIRANLYRQISIDKFIELEMKIGR